MSAVFDAQELYDDVAFRATAVDDTAPFKEDSGKSESTSSTSDSPPQHSVPCWSPPILRALPTGIFTLSLLLVIVALELLNRHSPYNAPSRSLQFVWTYVPVGVLMVIHWIWTAYDLQIKILVPWAAMLQGPTPAEQSWLLDYLGVNPIVGLWTALRYRHVVVLLTTIGLWMTALAGIVTTSLFELQENVHSTPAEFALTTVLNRSLLTDFEPSILGARQYVSSYLGRQVLNLSRPYWTTSDDIVVEAFGDASGSVTDRLIAQTQGYSAELDCLPAAAVYGGNVSIPANPPTSVFPVGYALFVNVTASGCTVKYPLTDTNHLILCYGSEDTCLVGRAYNHTCPGSSKYTTALVLASVPNFTLASISAVECSPAYSQYLLEVSASPSSSGTLNSSIVSNSTDSLMDNNLQGMVQWLNSTNDGPPRFNTASRSRELDPFIYWGQVENITVCDCDPWFFLIAHAQNLDVSALLQPATLLNASEATFPGVFSEVAQALLMETAPPSAATLSGSVQNTVSQLVARPTSIRIVQATISILLAVVLAVFFLRPVSCLPMDPSSMAAQAVLMASNHDDISAVIKDTITQTSAETQTLLEDWWFRIDTRGKFRISAERRGTSSPGAAKFVKAPVWRPPILHPLFKLLLGLILVGTIIALELCLRKSEHNSGFADFVPSNQDWWTYAAPAYLFVLGALLSSYAFSVSTLEPLFAMHQRPQPPQNSVRYSPVTKTDVGLLLHSFTFRSVAGFVCAVIMLMIPFLKIAISGLITIASEPAQRVALLAATTTFNTTPPNQGLFGDIPKEILALSQIQTYQLPLPAWTVSVGAIAQVDTTRLVPIVQSANTTITMPFEVMRADLGNCSSVDLSATTIQSQFGFSESSSTLPASPGWFGRVFMGTSVDTANGYTFIYGQTQATNASDIQDATVVECLSYGLSVATQNVTFTYKNDTIQILSVAPGAQTPAIGNITYPIDPLPQSVLLGTPTPPTYETNSSLTFDTLFQIMTLKNPSTPLETFLDPETLITAAQAIFATYGAICASLYQRIPIPEASQTMVQVAVDYSQTRIVQAQTPTRILQALLGFVLALGLVTALVVRQTNNVLTKPPYSIGATMGLLADSAFVELAELQKISDEADLDRILEPYEFQLGWGRNPKGGMRFGVDIVAR
ncbi:hypothetical protein K438DRAFT_1974009 [Mycena galopus ATCC 62051]|nr:hypothetical protein K438DRAFT_1974009 [Mycena galopus ATCC 62051]